MSARTGSGLPRHSPAAGASADARLAVRQFVRTCVEVLNGHRPPAHLRRLARPMEASDVVAQGTAAAHRVSDLRRAAARPGRRRPSRPSPVAVLHLRLCEPRPGAVEAAVALMTADRTWALALRLELHQEAWRATALRLI
ncbi:Rv3235 family protein [Actinoplanes sp. M2I2]|uniref:Rv3235 family protein n=1 Tax=Actinoplanes sp. M2I2 TaxID=1734444 RepID=UPI00202266E2|nr:Rv3235 family protein [Actinoplanes sp. M2I2]